MNDKKMISYVYRLFFNISATIFPIKKKTVIFESFNGKKPSDSPYAIYQALKSENPNWRCFWGIKKLFGRSQKGIS